MTEELPVLHTKIGLQQDDLSGIIGVPRQIYSSIATQKRRISWNTYLLLILVFENNEKTKNLLDAIGVFPEELIEALKIDRRSTE